MDSPLIVIAFYVIGIAAVVSALGVVLSRSIAHSVLFLIATFAAAAGVYLILGADFVSAVQILIYAGAITILFIFAIMMTRGSAMGEGNPSNAQRGLAGVVALLLLLSLGFAVTRMAWPEKPAPSEATTNGIGWLLLNVYALPFEIASVLLLVAMVGAIALAQED